MHALLNRPCGAIPFYPMMLFNAALRSECSPGDTKGIPDIRNAF